MTISTRDNLRRALARRYRQLRDRLSQRLGSEAQAEEVLNETWVRLGNGAELGPVENEEGYVFRAAVNTAYNMRVSDERHTRHVGLEALGDHADEAPDPERVADAKAQVGMVMAALDELPARQRDVFLSCFMRGLENEEIAKKHGVSVRTVQTDLRAAVVHCARRLGRKDILADRTFKVSR
ncbi:RNA polymerase sigma-70 factor, ECF subfamily [Sphingomonas laterariae]|uniref:RNA polymerase sigma-70 factor, ECF subfamily n=1 Tax=Edaphosphingomonas laterariae TaxID=861865 RepID=A0A239GIS2_9SPHN|nr:RNA polymerase sigma factor [Sphingomonas laterariae]SNS69186.1 RNA polymerase sigma-70 factor, ECF subfamily [Sphingomonas laterariae]